VNSKNSDNNFTIMHMTLIRRFCYSWIISKKMAKFNKEDTLKIRKYFKNK